ncbi:MAG: hypothetical protein ACI89J_003096, partial [Hyphomicrobiaceae bacterium]
MRSRWSVHLQRFTKSDRKRKRDIVAGVGLGVHSIGRGGASFGSNSDRYFCV